VCTRRGFFHMRGSCRCTGPGGEHYTESRLDIQRAFVVAGLQGRLCWLEPGVAKIFQRSGASAIPAGASGNPAKFADGNVKHHRASDFTPAHFFRAGFFPLRNSTQVRWRPYPMADIFVVNELLMG